MLLREAEIVALDFETTGVVRCQENIPWQIGCARIRNGVLEKETLSLYLKVPSEHHFNPYTPGRWAEMRETLAQKRTLLEEWPVLEPWLSGHLLAAHNVPVERSILSRYFPLHHFGPWIDTLKMARGAYPNLKSKRLSDLLEALSLTERMHALCPMLEAHDACYDAVGCACVLEYFLSLPGWRELDVEALSFIG